LGVKAGRDCGNAGCTDRCTKREGRGVRKDKALDAGLLDPGRAIPGVGKSGIGVEPLLTLERAAAAGRVAGDDCAGIGGKFGASYSCCADFCGGDGAARDLAEPVTSPVSVMVWSPVFVPLVVPEWVPLNVPD